MEREFLQQLEEVTTHSELNKIIEKFVDVMAEEDAQILALQKEWKKKPDSLEKFARLAELYVCETQVSGLRKEFRNILQTHLNRILLASNKPGKN